jgi:glutaredoxin-related protein
MVMIVNKKTSKKSLEKFLKSRKAKKAFNPKKYLGAIRFDEDALAIQKRMRNEWE